MQTFQHISISCILLPAKQQTKNKIKTCMHSFEHFFVVKIVCIFAEEQNFRTHSQCSKLKIVIIFQFQLHNDTSIPHAKF